MKKLLYTFISLIFALIFSAIIFYIYLPEVVSTSLSKDLKTHVRVGKIKFSKDNIFIENISVSNPKKAKLPYALKIKKVTINSPLLYYFRNPTRINEILIEDVYVNIQVFDKDQKSSNWQDLLSNANSTTNKNTSNKSITSQHRIIISKLIFQNVKIDLILSDGKINHLTENEPFIFNDLDTKEGIPTKEIGSEISSKMISQIYLKYGIKSIINAPKTIIKKILPFMN